jgi:hypothetical protein
MHFYSKKPPIDLTTGDFLLDFRVYNPMQLVAPRAVSTAEIIEARICSVHLSVSFLVISYKL